MSIVPAKSCSLTGQTEIPIYDRETGELHEASLFAAVLGGRNYTYAEACWSQKTSWLGDCDHDY